jgi:hypothetical protein
MTIQEILAKHYNTFASMCINTDKAVYGGKTSEDILNDSIITIINHFGNMDISEEEGYEYAKKTFLMEEQFSYKKKSWDKEKMIDFISDYPQNL